MIPANVMKTIIGRLRPLLPGMTVCGEKPHQLARHLPCLVVSRLGGREVGSLQDIGLADRPIVQFTVYARSADAAEDAMTRARRAIVSIGGRPNTGPIPVSNENEAATTRRLACTYLLTVRGEPDGS